MAVDVDGRHTDAMIDRGTDFPEIYSISYYAQHTVEPAESETRSVARAILRLVNEDRDEPVASVIDVGCANGVMLSEFANMGVKNYWGIDSPHAVKTLAGTRLLRIPAERILQVDLRDIDRAFHDEAFSRPPLDTVNTVDLVICSETGEHLPAEQAEGLMRLLRSLCHGYVVFGAAHEGQDGASNKSHINERDLPYWTNMAGLAGLVYDEWMSRRLKSRIETVAPHCPWFHQNLAIYRVK